MRCAVLAVSSQGAALSRLVRDALDGDTDIYVNEKYMGAAPDGAKPYRRLAEYVGEIFHRYDGLIFIAAAGIAVRMIAPHLMSKLEDPAVLVMDERGRHVISLLSGHIGGANLLARQLAKSLGGEAVITTATDVEGKLAPDAVAASLALRPWPKEQIELLNSALLQGETIPYYVDESMPRAEFYSRRLREYKLSVHRMERDGFPTDGLRVLVVEEPGDLQKGALYLSPRRLIAGIGCRQGTEEQLIRRALDAACHSIGQEISSVSLLASTIVKKEEQGLLSLAETMGREICFFDNEALQSKIDDYHLKESSFVKSQIGVGNVCEAAALACVTSGRFALPKTKYEKVTVALIWER
ncbi:MAG: cobalamin biosynthesis protein [Selenomonadaceae bacterium]|nr:cobalamin biosynthesis protein [Selenomonadaceae bacterium]